MVIRSSQQNQLLASLARDDLARLEPHLERVPLNVRDMIEYPNQPITQIVFPCSGLVSIVAHGGEYRLEVGIVGREGMTGVSAVLGAESSPHECFVQIAGDGLRIGIGEFKSALAERPAMLARLLLYVRSLLLQTSQTALANGRFTIEERLARWLLMTQDRLEADEIPLTHEFLALMLGVRRPGVTVALQALEGERAIRNDRGSVRIINRHKLEDMAGDAYPPWD